MEPMAIHSLDAAWALRDTQRGVVRAALAALVAAADDLQAADHAQVICAYLDYRLGHYAAAASAGLAALEVLEHQPPTVWLPRLYNTLAAISFDLGERDTCRAYLDRQLRLCRALGDSGMEAIGYHDLGLVQAAVDAPAGIATLEQARARFQAARDPDHEALALYNIANIQLHARLHTEAFATACEARQLLGATRQPSLATSLRVHLATLMAEVSGALGRSHEAAQQLRAAATIALAHSPELVPHVRFCQGLHFAMCGDDVAAQRHFEEALARATQAGSMELRADCHAALADCLERQGDYRAALAEHRAYAALRERTFREVSEQRVRALDVMHRVELARQAAEAERQRNASLQRTIQELEQQRTTLQRMTTRDPLTGLFNRRYLVDEGARLLAAARHSALPLCAAMIDVDGFKQINDSFGHLTGDQVLKQLAELCAQGLRSSDWVARYGGEELVVLLPATPLRDAVQICERLRVAVKNHTWASIQPELHVTISIGLTADAAATLEQLFGAADAQLYAAKRAGRNQTQWATCDAGVASAEITG